MVFEVKEEEKDFYVVSPKEVGLFSWSPVSDSSCETSVSRSATLPRRTGRTRRSSKLNILMAALIVKCLHRWQKVVNPENVKGPWTKVEDDRIIELVKNYGCGRWSFIAKSLPGLIGKQCRERWHNHLDPDIRRDAWSKQEDSILTYYHQIYGNKLTEIASFLPGRTGNAKKNQWNCVLMKKLSICSFCDFALDMNGIKSPVSCSCEIKPGGIKLKADRLCHMAKQALPVRKLVLSVVSKLCLHIWSLEMLIKGKII